MTSREEALIAWILASHITIEIFHVGDRSYTQLLKPEPDDVRRTTIRSINIVGTGSLQAPYKYLRAKSPSTLYACVVYLWVICRPRSDAQEFFAVVPSTDPACVILTRKGVRAMDGAFTRLVAR